VCTACPQAKWGGGDDSLDGSQGDDVIDSDDGTYSADGGRGSDTCIKAERVSDCLP
jgi:Ca2+-binding RTX toxin-like protein